jgi:hypothetical protein
VSKEGIGLLRIRWIKQFSMERRWMLGILWTCFSIHLVAYVDEGWRVTSLAEWVLIQTNDIQTGTEVVDGEIGEVESLGA